MDKIIWKPSKAFEKLCHESESCRLTAYKCPAGKPTIGWGHTGPDVQLGMTITQEQADRYFIEDCRYFIDWLNRNISFKSQNKFDAVLDLIYNIGPGNLVKNADLYLALKNDQNNKDRICKGFRKHVYANGTHDGKDNDGDGLIDEKGEVQKLKGLENRREKELNLYFMK